jgi:hypothetical protein
MKTILTTFAMTAFILVLPVKVSASDIDSLFVLTPLHNVTPASLTQVQDTELSHMRAQGIQMPDIHTGVILWDEVDSGQKPKPHYMGTDGAISIKVESR